jgi:hypothetical protein
LKGRGGGVNAEKNYQSTLVRPCLPGSCCHKLITSSEEVNLGLSVEPAQVRLITTKDDLYSWKILPGKEHLFEKQLSKHSIGAYMELFREVGVSFEAVLAGETTSLSHGSDSSITFSAKISELERDKSELTEELCQWRTRAERAEKDINHLRLRIHALGQQDKQKMALINSYRNITIKSLKEANGAFEKFMLLGFNRKRDTGWGMPAASPCCGLGDGL